VFAVAAVAGLACVIVLALHLAQREALRRAAAERGELRQARVDLAHGALHAVLGRGEGPFDPELGRARLTQALTAIEEASLRLEPAALADEVAADAGRLRESLGVVPVTPESAARVRIGLQAVERHALRLDAETLERRDRLAARQDWLFDWMLGLAAVALAAAVLGELAYGRAREAAERALRGERARLETLLHTLPDAVWLKDPDGVYRGANPSFERLVGRPEAELPGGTDFDIFDADLARFFQERDRAAIAAGGPVMNEEWVVSRADGRRVLLETIKTPTFDSRGRLTGVLGIARDITARRRAEGLVEKQGALLARTSALAHVGGWEFDVETGEGAWTDEVARIHDVDPGAPTSAEIGLGFFHGPHRAALERAIREAIEERRPYDLELEMVSARGVRKWVRTVGQPVVEEGRVRKMQGVFQDVTERRQAEESLRRSEELLRQLAENVQEVFWITDPGKRQMLYVSPTYERIWGRSVASLLADPRSWVAAVHPEDRERVTAAMLRQAEGGYDEEYRIVRPDGSLRVIHDRAFPVRSAGGELARIVGIAEDVTEARDALQQRLALQEQLRHAQKMEAIGRLAGGVAHDFNNMLGVILGHAELAQKQLPADHALRRHVEQIQAAAERSAGLTRQLLAFSRKQTIAPRPLDLAAEVQRMGTLLRRVIGEHVELELRAADAACWPVRADPSQLDQVLANLAVNARDAMPGGGRLSVETANVSLDPSQALSFAEAAAGDYVRLAVSDTGHGMSPATLERAFEPFFTTKPEGQGTGLGLSTVYGIAQQNGGFVHLESAPGQGTTVAVYLPRLATGEVVESPPVEPAAAAAGGETILLVEDETALRELGQELLEDLGYAVLSAASGPEALALAADAGRQIDLLLTDVVMPGMNGHELASRLREARPGLPVLYASGYTADAIAQHGVLEPGLDLIEKPFTAAALAARVRAALDRRSRPLAPAARFLH
jgi:PAS domain S-box-containing protein